MEDTSTSGASSLAAPLERQPPITRVFTGPSGVRAGWRLLLYVLMVYALGRLLILGVTHVPWLSQIASPGPMSPGRMISAEATQFLVVLIPALIMGRLEWRSPGAYGLPLRRGSERHLLAGMLWGLVIVSAVIGGIALLHGYDVSGLALSGGAIVEYGIFWFIAFVLVGFFEEFAFRGYTQFTLATGIGFWPAAVLLSAAFGFSHLSNPGEEWVGALQVFLVAMFFCLTLRRTGNLWFAVGVHATFDWAETFLYSVPNSGQLATGHLLSSSLHGGPWLSGGSVGPEGSVVCFVVVALAIVVFAWRYPASDGHPMDRASTPLPAPAPT